MSIDQPPTSVSAPRGDSEVIHALKNHLCIIVGFSELLLDDCADDHPQRAELHQIHKAAVAAMAIMPEVDRRSK
jgi:hypothetical protein